MSTLVTATVKSNSSSPPAFQNSSGTEIGTLCRAWVNFNGTSTVAIRAQFNVSSITDNGTGDYTVNFSSALADASYAITGTGGSGVNTGTVFMCPRVADPTSSAARMYALNAADTLQDVAFISIIVNR